MPDNFVTPDTGAFLLLGLAVTTAAVLGYIASLWMRFRGVQRDEETLRELQS
jgi:hypothetical protein